MLELVAKFHPQLQQHLEESSVFKGTSATIQNELISCISGVIVDQIKQKLNDAMFVSVLMDESTDVSRKSQLSVVFCYVSNCGEIKERFYIFEDISSGRTGRDIADFIINLLKSLNIIGQASDGASVMSGQIKGVQKLVRDEFSMAKFIHCNAHILNLALTHSANYMSSVKKFFKALSAVSSFFSHSTKRTFALTEIAHKKLPTMAPTRWNFSSLLIQTVDSHLDDLLELYDGIIQDESNQWDEETTVLATGFKTFLEKFETSFFFLIFC